MKSSAAVHHQHPAVEENMSNLTTSEASVSSNNDVAPTYPVKRKRNQPGHPDPDAEVVALSPKTLMATNRFVCEVCGKGFQRDQNLQLHRRGHNLPWKLKQRANKDVVVRKKVYVCPETGCVHHDPSRALGDLTGIKKHFCRKHGEKKWKCDKCSKRYAVQSDWKAHSKTCGTREYRCDCGTLFSRRDSFITHRAFCDALAEESARTSSTAGIGNTTTDMVPSAATQMNLQIQSQFRNFANEFSHHHQQFSVKEEQHHFNLMRPEIPPWLVCPPSVGPRSTGIDLPVAGPSPSSSSSIFQGFHHNPNPSTGVEPTGLLNPYHQPAAAHISATALLQKAAQMGAKSSSCPSTAAGVVSTSRPHQQQQAHVSGDEPGAATTNGLLDLSSRDDGVIINGLASCGNKAASGAVSAGSGTVTGGLPAAAGNPGNPPPPSLIHEMMMISEGGMGGFGGILRHEQEEEMKVGGERLMNFGDETLDEFSRSRNGTRSSEGMTRDFLGLRNLSESEILSITGFANTINNVHQSPKSPWQGN